jgi:hypothetical protein
MIERATILPSLKSCGKRRGLPSLLTVKMFEIAGRITYSKRQM